MRVRAPRASEKGVNNACTDLCTCVVCVEWVRVFIDGKHGCKRSAFSRKNSKFSYENTGLRRNVQCTENTDVLLLSGVVFFCLLSSQSGSGIVRNFRRYVLVAVDSRRGVL